jgi:hypothetical protein
MSSDTFDKRIARERADGWRVKERSDDWALLHKPNFGTRDGHVLLAAVTVWWAFGLANAAYALLAYWYDTPTKVLEADDPLGGLRSNSPDATESNRSADDADAEPSDPLTILRERYARGEIDEAEFERRVERLLETDSIDAARRSRDWEDERDRESAVERS